MKKLIQNKWFAIGLIVIATFGVYANSSKNEFVWDDIKIIKDNKSIKDLNNLKKIFTKDYFKISKELSYRPVATFTYFLLYKIFKLNTWKYHLTNTLFHISIALLIYLLFTKLYKNKMKGFIAALIFSCHPINTEAVLEISFNEELLVAFFICISLLSYIKYEEIIYKEFLKKSIYYSISLLSFILSLFSKETGLVLIPILFLYCLFFKNKIKIKELLGFLIVAFVYLYIRFFVFKTTVESVINYPGGSFYTNILTMLPVSIEYLKLLFLPFNLSIEHLYPIEMSFFSYRVIYSIFIIILILGIMVKTADKQINFSIMWIFICLIPVFNFIPFLKISFLQERYLYLSSIGFGFLIGLLLEKFERRSVKIKNMIYVLLIIFISVSSVTIVNRNSKWKDEMIFWLEASRNCPKSYRIHHCLGDLYSERNMHTKAIYHYERSMQLAPDYVFAYAGLAKTYIKIKLFDEAIAVCQKALNIFPVYPAIYSLLGAAYTEKRDYKQAYKMLKKTIEIEPYKYDNYLNLARFYVTINSIPEAIESYQTSLKFNPDVIPSWFSLGVLYEREKNYRNAIKCFKKVLAIVPDYPNLQNRISLLEKNL
ncbi:MAG: tetratricopeptide repeat protein [Elusimicrobiota bacterium]